MKPPLIPPRPDLAEGYYTQIYADLVQPGRIWSVSKYFLRRWSRYFPAHHHFWAIVAARQLAYLNQNRSWCKAHDTVLAGGAGLNVDHFRRQIKHQLGAAPGQAIDVFLARGKTTYVREGDVTRPGPTRYRVRLDDPLVPADADHLRGWLSNAAAAFPATPAGIAALLQQAQQLPAGALCAPELPPPAEAVAQEIAVVTVGDIVVELFGEPAGTPAVQEAAEALHTHIVRPLQVYIGTHYFREQWLPLLGPGPAFLLTYLRSHTYYNEQTGELRDDVTVTLPELAETVGVSRNTLPRWLKRLDAAVPEQIWGPFLSERGRERSANATLFTFGVNLNDPLLPGDLRRYQELLRTVETAPQKVGDTVPVAAPESRAHSRHGRPEKSVTHPATQPQEVGDTAAMGTPDSRPQVPAGSPRKSVTRPTGPSEQRPHRPAQPQKVGPAAPKSRSLKTYKDLLTTGLGIKARTLETSWATVTVANPDRLAAPLSAVVAADWGELFATLAIHGQARQQLETGGLAPADVLAWYLFALDQSWTTHPVGYVIQRAAAGESSPPRYQEFAALPLAGWHIFALATAWRDRLPDVLWEAVAADPLFGPWRQVYGALPFGELPCGAGDALRELLDRLRAGADHAAAPEPDPPPPTLTAADRTLWHEVLDELALQMTRATFDSCLHASRLISREGAHFVVAVANEAALAWVERRLRPVVSRTVAAFAGVAQPELRFVVNLEEDTP